MTESPFALDFLGTFESLRMGPTFARGRRDERAGHVRSLTISSSLVVALVRGPDDPRAFRSRIAVRAFGAADWARVEDALAAEARYTASLLAGRMPPGIAEVFGAAGLTLVPLSLDEVAMDCTCERWPMPCIHLAATTYALVRSFEEDPFGVFAWRGRTRDELLTHLRDLRSTRAVEAQSRAAASPAGASPAGGPHAGASSRGGISTGAASTGAASTGAASGGAASGGAASAGGSFTNGSRHTPGRSPASAASAAHDSSLLGDISDFWGITLESETARGRRAAPGGAPAGATPAGPASAGATPAEAASARATPAGPASAGSASAGSASAGSASAGSVSAGATPAGPASAGSVSAGSVSVGATPAGPASAGSASAAAVAGSTASAEATSAEPASASAGAAEGAASAEAASMRTAAARAVSAGAAGPGRAPRPGGAGGGGFVDADEVRAAGVGGGGAPGGGSGWGVAPPGSRPGSASRPDALLDQLDPPPLSHAGRPIVELLRPAYLALPEE